MDTTTPDVLRISLEDDDSEVCSQIAKSSVAATSPSISSEPLSYDQPRLDEIDIVNIIPNLRRNRGVRMLRVSSVVYACRVAITSTTLPPKNFAQIAGRPDADLWRQAYFDAIQSLQTTANMTVVKRPHDARIIPILEIFTTKRDGISGFWKAKCHIVGRGDLQFTPTTYFAPVASIVALRLFIFFSSCFQTSIHQLDVKTAFLYGRLCKPIYLQLPVGHPSRSESKKIWKTSTAVYGLVEAPQVWNRTIHNFLTEFGYPALLTECCMYVRHGRIVISGKSAAKQIRKIAISGKSGRESILSIKNTHPNVRRSVNQEDSLYPKSIPFVYEGDHHISNKADLPKQK